MADAQYRWRVSSDEPLKIRYWDGDYVVYNPLSGKTHFLEIVSGRILELIIAESPPTDRIYTMIATFLDLDIERPVVEAVDNHITLLEQVGLVESVP